MQTAWNGDCLAGHSHAIERARHSVFSCPAIKDKIESNILTKCYFLVSGLYCRRLSLHRMRDIMFKQGIVLPLIAILAVLCSTTASAMTEEEEEVRYSACMKKASDPDAVQACKQESIRFWDGCLDDKYDIVKAACKKPRNENVSADLCGAKLLSTKRSWERYRDEMDTLISALYDKTSAKAHLLSFIREATKNQALAVEAMMQKLPEAQQ